MREIKFRAWDGQMMHYGINLTKEGRGIKCGYQWFSPDNTLLDAPVMQYTGLKDEDGVVIYEGDIVRFQECDYGEPSIDTVAIEWGFGGWMGRYAGSGDSEMIDDLCIDDHVDGTVIGNVYENPELKE